MPSRPASLPRRHRQIFSRGTTSTSQPRSSRRARRRRSKNSGSRGTRISAATSTSWTTSPDGLDSRRLRGGARQRVPRLRSESGQLHARGVVVGPGRRDRDRRRSPPRVAASGRSAQAVCDRVERARRRASCAAFGDRRRHGRRHVGGGATWCSTRRSITSGRANLDLRRSGVLSTPRVGVFARGYGQMFSVDRTLSRPRAGRPADESKRGVRLDGARRRARTVRGLRAAHRCRSARLPAAYAGRSPDSGCSPVSRERILSSLRLANARSDRMDNRP